MTQALSALAALGHPTRLAVFRRLVAAGPQGCVAGDLAIGVDVPAATLSFHLKELAHAALIEPQPEGRYVRYRANSERMNALIAYLTENCCAGNPDEDCAPAKACRPPRPKRRADDGS